MIFTQYYLGCLSQASYLIGDERTGTAVVVDPRRDVDEYVADAAARGLRIEHAILTHFHADFVAGHLELRDRVGARIHLGGRAQADYDFSPLRDGDVLELGQVRLRVLETPGHTPEAISLLLYDLAVSDREPQAVLTGDTLFIGDVGRPDLMASVGVSADELAGMLYDSIHQKLLALPDATLVYPGHGAGSACGKHLSQERVSTIGVQRQYNYALQPMSRERFVQVDHRRPAGGPALLRLRRRPEPARARHARRRSRPRAAAAPAGRGARGPAGRRSAPRRAGAGGLRGRSPGRQPQRQPGGPVRRVGRNPALAGAPHRPGHGARPRAEAAIRLGRVGFDSVAGYLDGGIEAARNRPDLVRRVERVTAGALRELLQAERLPVLDVRTETEWRSESIPGSVNVPLHELRARLADVPAGPGSSSTARAGSGRPPRSACSRSSDAPAWSIWWAGSWRGSRDRARARRPPSGR